MIYPGLLVIVGRPGYVKYIRVRDISNQLGRESAQLTMPMLVLTYLNPPPGTWRKPGDHNVMLLGSNGNIGWLPEEWVKPC